MSAPAPPGSFDGPEVVERIAGGLRGRGIPERAAERAAKLALLEAPFAAPTDASWRLVCQAARGQARRLTVGNEEP